MKLLPPTSSRIEPWQDAKQDLVRQARERLETHTHFHGHCDSLKVEWIDEHLVLTGKLPSFHLKQLAQVALLVLDVPIVNRIQVVSCHGLSSTNNYKGIERSTSR